MNLDEFDHHTPIEGTTLFDGQMAMIGYPLNKMCFSFNKAAAREAYMESFGLDEAHKSACRNKNVLELIAAGGNIYYLATFPELKAGRNALGG
jgi:protocatechuate 4,5-dioxygenase alpha chain